MFLSARRLTIFIRSDTNQVCAGVLNGNKIIKATKSLTAEAINAVVVHLERRREETGKEREVIEFPDSQARLIWERELPPPQSQRTDIELIADVVVERLTQKMVQQMQSSPAEETQPLPIQMEAKKETGAGIGLSDEQLDRLMGAVTQTVKEFMFSEKLTPVGVQEDGK